jgi:hypothetical protein
MKTAEKVIFRTTDQEVGGSSPSKFTERWPQRIDYQLFAAFLLLHLSDICPTSGIYFILVKTSKISTFEAYKRY